MARPYQGADDGLRCRYARPLLPLADARHVDGRVRKPRQTHDGHRGRSPCGRAAGLAGQNSPGMQRIDAPTSYIWIVGRTQTSGPRDYSNAVNHVQDGFSVAHLSIFGKGRSRCVVVNPAGRHEDGPADPSEYTCAADKYFACAAELLKVNPPHITNKPILARMRRLGLEPGKSFDFKTADAVDPTRVGTRRPRRPQGHERENRDPRPCRQRLANEHRYDGRVRELLPEASDGLAGRPRRQRSRGCGLSAEPRRRRR